jgi:branched-chain amino acid transport system ATP-binding protein
MPILTVASLTKTFGGLTAVSNVDLSLYEGELVGLIGPNGAGKTTVFNLLTGVYTPAKGDITLNANDKTTRLNGKKPNKVCRLGLGRTFQNIRLFKDLTVLDNVRIAMHDYVKYGFFSAYFHLPPFRRVEEDIVKRSMELLSVFNLEKHKDDLAKNLPYGDQRKLEIARALATNPSILLLDEPAAGMNPAETAQLTELIAYIREKFKVTILLIEHDMSLVMRICERIYVLDYGMVIAEGKPEEIQANPRVIKAYLGEEANDA